MSIGIMRIFRETAIRTLNQQHSSALTDLTHLRRQRSVRETLAHMGTAHPEISDQYIYSKPNQARLDLRGFLETAGGKIPRAGCREIFYGWGKQSHCTSDSDRGDSG
jgi:hypothetical protein